jgi:TonB-dependent SusC/RagA subfamily outer membrane receptor
MGNTEPLVIIDGSPVLQGPGGGLSGLNPRDIASIEVVKDVSSLALYGVRGANGVILVKTKAAASQ